MNTKARSSSSRARTSEDAAIGLRAHSGWASLIALTGPLESPAVVERRRIELADETIPGSVQPYHAAAILGPEEAKRFINRCRDASMRLARHALKVSGDELRRQNYRVVACGLLQSSARPLPALAAVLASHALIHTAEGELFRDVLAEAATDFDLPVLKVREREIFDRIMADLRIAAAEVQRRLAGLGRALGPPWRQDEKLATLVAWLALTDPGAKRA